MAIPARPARGRIPVRRGSGKRIVEGRSFRLADEVRYIQRRAADHDGRIVSIGQLILFSTDTGDAWLLDPADRLAARLARDGESEPIHIEETDTTFAIEGPLSHRGIELCLLRSRYRPRRHHPRISGRQAYARNLNGKFQISLARIKQLSDVEALPDFAIALF